MELAGQPFNSARDNGNRGYAMAALLVGMSVMAVLMGALLPVWTQMATREKEEELIFRGKQYARAIGLWQRKYANTPPPTIDILVEQRFLRKKYKDPITNDDFQPIYANQQAQQGVSAPQGAARPGQQASATMSTPATPTGSTMGSISVGNQQGGGIIGVTSKSKDASIKLYNGRDKYNEWAFVYIQTTQRPGQAGGAAGAQQPGQRPGAQGNQGPGGRGNFQQPPSGFGQPNRPPIGSPGMTPGGTRPPDSFTSPFGSPTATPPGGTRRPPGQ